MATVGPRIAAAVVGVVVWLVVLAAPGRADACGVPDFGQMLADIAISLSGEHEPVSEPVLIANAGITTEGWSGGAAIGWMWGDRQIGGLFPGTSAKRVLFGVRAPFSGDDDADAVARTSTGLDAASEPLERTRFSLTYGWFDNTLIEGGIDVGLVGNHEQLGPIAQLSLGGHGLGLRLTAGVELGRDTRFAGGAELYADITRLVRRR